MAFRLSKKWLFYTSKWGEICKPFPLIQFIYKKGLHFGVQIWNRNFLFVEIKER